MIVNRWWETQTKVIKPNGSLLPGTETTDILTPQIADPKSVNGTKNKTLTKSYGILAKSFILIIKDHQTNR